MATTNQYTKKVDGTVCTKSGISGSCVSGICNPGPVSPTTCADGTYEGSCCATPGQKCKKDASNNLVCQADTDPTCSSPCSAPVSYTTLSACTGAVSGAGASCGYYWCDSSHTPASTCVQSLANCAAPSTGGCSSLNFGACNGDTNCKWCGGTSSCVDYDAGTSANGGTCYGASIFASKCD